jgi:hypothetical protein
MAVRVLTFLSQIFTQIINPEQHYVGIFSNEFLPILVKKYGKCG